MKYFNFNFVNYFGYKKSQDNNFVSPSSFLLLDLVTGIEENQNPE